MRRASIILLGRSCGKAPVSPGGALLSMCSRRLRVVSRSLRRSA